MGLALVSLQSAQQYCWGFARTMAEVLLADAKMQPLLKALLFQISFGGCPYCTMPLVHYVLHQACLQTLAWSDQVWAVSYEMR